ncbi:putative membrane protein [Neobacillus sp. B4I6]|uniref:hypothetical protein n=1 Tax=Neobacillus sp. B4I6 TaxID=3373925 RepID=UPI003D1B43E0
MRIFWCFLYIFALNGLIMGSMVSDFFIEIFGKISKVIPPIFGVALMMLIREYYKEIKGLIFGVLFVVSLLAYMVLTGIFVK